MPDPLPDADLIAYLDGELDDEASGAVEARLASDPALRKKADAFRRSFALLDALPRPAAPADFTAKTVTRLQVPGQSTAALRPTRPRRWGWLTAAAAVLLAGLGGAAARLAMRSESPAPAMADLPAIEGLPLYLGADDLAFVRRLDIAGHFPPEPAGGGFALADPSPEVRDKLLAAFQSLPPTRQRQIRTLHAELTALPPAERDRLGRVLERYAGWLQRLPADERAKVFAARTAEARLTAVEDAVLTARREALPARTRERLPALRTDERLQLLADGRAAERAADAEWATAGDHWRTLTGGAAKPFPFDQPGGSERVDEFVKTVLRAAPAGKPDESCRLNPAELADLRARHDLAGREGQWFLYGLGVWRLADRHPSLPKPRAKPAVVHPRDLADLKLQPRALTQLEKLPGVGKWPEFARAAAGLLGGKKVLPVPTDGLGPCRPGEFPEPVEAVIAELPESDRKRLDAVKGKWPDYPDLLMRLAREKDREVPGVTLPGPPSKWAATYSLPNSPR